jgi:repressor LexA
MTKNEISERQIEILQCIVNKVKESGYPPTVREIAATVKLHSAATIHAHLTKLEKLGYIKRDPEKPRAIEIMRNIYNQDEDLPLPSENNVVLIPVLGAIAAGTPILAEENIEEYFPVSSDFVKGTSKVFMLKVKGDSMVNAGILDKDYIVIRKQETAMNGEIVAVLLEDEATVKRSKQHKTNARK